MRFNPDVSQLLAIREAVHQILNLSDASDQDS
jgi:hypothetical protein